jgi:hypothetical protein
MALSPKNHAVVLPAYRIPLTPEQTMMLGTFMAVWGQIDHFLGLCISALLKVDPFAAETLMENMTTGPRLNLFHRLTKSSPLSPEARKIAKAFYTDLSSLIEKRNQLMHGIWGIEVRGAKSFGASVYYAKTNARLLATELPDLVIKAAYQTHRIVTIATYLTTLTWSYDSDNPPLFMFGELSEQQRESAWRPVGHPAQRQNDPQ